MLSKVIAQANVDHVEKWLEKADKIVKTIKIIKNILMTFGLQEMLILM